MRRTVKKPKLDFTGLDRFALVDAYRKLPEERQEIMAALVDWHRKDLDG